MAIAAQYADLSIGSYPSFGTAGGRNNQIVLRGKDEALLAKAADDVRALIAQLVADRATS